MCKTGRLGTPHGVRSSVWNASQEYLSSVYREMRQTCHGRTQARNRAGHRTSAHRGTAFKWHSDTCGRFLARGPGSFGAHHAIAVPDELGSLSVERERLGLPFPPDLEEQLQGTATPLIQFIAKNDRAVDASSPAIVHYSGRGIAPVAAAFRPAVGTAAFGTWRAGPVSAAPYATPLTAWLT